MKSFVVESNTGNVNNITKYPVLAKSKFSGFIVLFTNECTGIVLQKSESVHEVGDFRDDWITVKDNEGWEILSNHYQLILQNEQ